MEDYDEERVLHISNEIKTYLQSHPKQMDTLRGIVDWWWDFERYRQTKRSIEQALDLLVKRGVVQTKEIGGERLFFLSEEK